MSAERGPLAIPPHASATQAKASHPAHSIWVEANAGSGKTFVLTQRVLRLLLAGVAPQSILCLTYTKAAAAEMRQRVGAQLAQWALAGDGALRDRLAALTGAPVPPELLATARTLFAKALETPGGLRILTIHAFCEAVLHRFPIEAGVPFDFAVIEDEQRDGMILAAREAVLAEGLRGGANSAAVETLFALMGDEAIGKAINAALLEGARLQPVLADRAGATARLAALVGGALQPVAALEAAMTAETLLAPDTLRAIVARCGGNAAGNRRCVDLLARLDPDAPDRAGLRAAFMTAKGPRASLLSKAEQAAFPESHALLLAEQERLVALDAALVAAQLVERSTAVLDVVAAIHARYERAKRRQSLLDFDDLVEKLGDLLADAAMGPWVRYKLDAGIDHILVDESQDTNARQWRVVKALAAEFFAGAGAVERPRSLFAVGDQKQSIYSFQGAEPVLFGQTGRDFDRRARQAHRHFEAVKLHTSFRTLPGILAAVDKVCAREDIRLALLSEERVGHEAARTQQGGTVTLWPPIAEAEAAAGAATGWPRQPLDAEQSAARQVALRLARAIKDWIGSGRQLGQRQRAVTADDVLVLVQSRGALFQEIIRALRLEGLPTPGADRLAVTGHIAVLDLLALIDVLLNPADSLQLAALLRSPLFDVTEEALFAIAAGRGRQSLWGALLASPRPEAKEAAARLGRWRAQLDFERPYEFLAGVLYAEGGLRRFHARLGPEVDEVLSELLELALAHEQGAQPSLQGFAAEMRRRQVTIKRELAEGGGGVRVMTVHGAKGLEAPIVILADAASKPGPQQTGKPVYVVPEAPGPLLIHAARTDQHVAATLAIKTAIDAVEAQEYWRRLYVAMTRAEDELYVTGMLTRTGSKDGSWYDAIETALRPEAEAVTDAAGAEIALVYPAVVAAAAAAPAPRPAPRPIMPLALAKVPEQPRPAIVSPSGAGDGAGPETLLRSLAEQVRDAEAARREGLALHALLQHLGKVERDAWAEVAPRALETLLPEAGAAHGRLAAKAIAILTRPELAPLFGPGSRAEVPFLVDAMREGEAVRLSGRIDRLVVDETRLLVVDYKSDAVVPDRAEAVPGRYLTQLGLYALVAGQLFPGRAVEAAILWTSRESLMNLPPERLAEARAGFTIR